MKKIFGVIAVILLGAALICGAVFIWLPNYYQGGFAVNTWINGVYCTGKTVAEVNEELINTHEASVIYIADANRTYWEIDMSSVGVAPDFTEGLQEFLKEDSSGFWTQRLQSASSAEFAVDRYNYEECVLKEAFMQLPFVTEELSKPFGVKVSPTEDGYELYDGNKMRLDTEKAFRCLKDALDRGETTLLLSECDCYADIEDSGEDLAQRNFFEQINEFLDCDLVYDMGAEQIEFTPKLVKDFLQVNPDNIPVVDESGNLMIDEDNVVRWVEELALKYNTCETERDFLTTRGDTVRVEYVTYGTRLDTEAEINYLLEVLPIKRYANEVHIPSYLQEGFIRGMDDIGGTYVEIDITNQMMYYYKDGEKILETAIVTGNLSKGWDTPVGINYVYNKQRNRTLRGPGYASFVKYWMPFKGGVGIHDASWRYRFGGEIYKKSGSHGCINTPSDIMSSFYEQVELGTPVITFY